MTPPLGKLEMAFLPPLSLWRTNPRRAHTPRVSLRSCRVLCDNFSAIPRSAVRLIVSMLVIGTGLRAATVPVAGAGLIESGSPSFVVLGPESLGLSAPPTDIHILPDGRTLVVAPHELALGDGVRWETFRRHPDAERVELNQVAMGSDGQIYASVAGHFVRIELGADAYWNFVRLDPFPPELAGSLRVLANVSEAAGEWYWSAGSGALVAWHPGRPAAVVGYMNDMERVLAAGGKLFVSDPSTGIISQIVGGKLEVFGTAAERNVRLATVSSVQLPDGRAIVGTYLAGARVFDGVQMMNLTDHGPLAGRYRIADLCAVGSGYYCGALDNLGLVFFDAKGRVVQVLDRADDHRLGLVRRLLPAPGGGVWALLNQGLALVEFPSRISLFDARVTTGLTYSELCRHEGRLWLLTDGQVQRGVYDDDERLIRFEVDSPEPFANTISSAAGRLVVATAQGIFWRVGSTWQLLAPDLTSVLAVAVREDPDRWFFLAQDQGGWLRFTPEGPQVERFAVPGLGNAFTTILETEGVFWAELGTGRVVRVQTEKDGRIKVRILGRDDGLPDGWVQAFLVDGRVRFNVAGLVWRYDEPSDRVVPDREFLKGATGLIGQDGRPMRDTSGRLWVTTPEGVRVIDDRADPTGSRSLERMPGAFRPISFSNDEGGVVWMRQRQRLVRFDPAIPENPPPPLRAIISHVYLPASNRHWLRVGRELPVLDYRDDSLVAQFLAPNAVFGTPVTFEVMLEGGGGTWGATGAAGSASFNRLKEGRYVLRVRPRSGANIGEEAALAFTISPPWFRTNLAYLSYGLGVLLLVGAAARGWTLIARREQARLERLVTARTGELRRSEASYRKLSEELEQRVDQRTGELHGANERLIETNRELESFSYSVSHDLRAPLRNISGFLELLRRRTEAVLDAEGHRFLGIVSAEAIRLDRLIDSLLVFSRLGRAELKRENLDPGKLVAAVRRELEPELGARAIEWHIAPLPSVAADPTLLRQVFANLISNALKFTRGRSPAVITIGVRTDPGAPGMLVFFVRDNGAGFDPKYIGKLFGVFQRLHSVKEFEGSGIGLANVQRIIVRHGGHVWAEGALGEGATFSFSLPVVAAAEPPVSAPSGTA